MWASAGSCTVAKTRSGLEASFELWVLLRNLCFRRSPEEATLRSFATVSNRESYLNVDITLCKCTRQPGVVARPLRGRQPSRRNWAYHLSELRHVLNRSLLAQLLGECRSFVSFWRSCHMRLDKAASFWHARRDLCPSSPAVDIHDSCSIGDRSCSRHKLIS